jgi:Ca-activated chloride channel family protein
MPAARRWLGVLPEVLRALAFTLLVLALARPRTVAGATEERTEGVPIVIAIDISSSMLARDMAVPGAREPATRLDVAKQNVARFITGRETDPIGLVAFAGEAITQVPLTLDHRVLESALGNLRVGLLEDGTAIGDGLATAVNRVRRASRADRVVVLMSDGANNRGAIEPLEAASAAAAIGVRVYTIGIGTDAAAPVRADTGLVGEAPAERAAGLDEALLRGIAERTGGRYFRAASGDALTRIYAEIDRLVRAPVEVRRYPEYAEWYLPLLLAGAAVLLLEWFVRGSRWGRVP